MRMNAPAHAVEQSINTTGSLRNPRARHAVISERKPKAELSTARKATSKERRPIVWRSHPSSLLSATRPVRRS